MAKPLRASRESALILRQMVSERKNKPHVRSSIDMEPYWDGGGGGVQMIRFQLVQITCGSCIAEGWVLSRPPGVGSVLHERDLSVFIGTPPSWQTVRAVPLYDRLACNIFHESIEDLIGRQGYAVLLNGALPAAFCDVTDEPSTQWEILRLCHQYDLCDPGSA